ncbi:MAG TPA: type II secretion system F family protein [Alphaproteobacteria bacterium]|nr:type II secretion system F family protein [Alphaproteobacteria bacterium]
MSFNGDDIAVLGAAVTAFLALLAVWHGLIVRDPVTSRLRALAEVRDQLRTSAGAGQRNQARRDIRASGMSVIRDAVVRFNLMRGRQVDRITDQLARAGWRSRDALNTYLFAKTFAPFIAIAGSALLFVFRSHLGIKPMYVWIMVGALAVIGLLGTDLIVRNAGDKRIKRLSLALPDALDLLVICAEAGLSLEAAIKRVGEEMASASADMSDELLLTGIELNFLPDRQRALMNLVKRTDMPKLRALVNSLVQSEKFGTPLANSLRVLSAEFRDERLMKAEEKAAKLPAIMTVPMIMFILPALFIIILGPVIIRIIDTLSHNNVH